LCFLLKKMGYRQMQTQERGSTVKKPQNQNTGGERQSKGTKRGHRWRLGETGLRVVGFVGGDGTTKKKPQEEKHKKTNVVFVVFVFVYHTNPKTIFGCSKPPPQTGNKAKQRRFTGNKGVGGQKKTRKGATTNPQHKNFAAPRPTFGNRTKRRGPDREKGPIPVPPKTHDQNKTQGRKNGMAKSPQKKQRETLRSGTTGGGGGGGET